MRLPLSASAASAACRRPPCPPPKKCCLFGGHRMKLFGGCCHKRQPVCVMPVVYEAPAPVYVVPSGQASPQY